MLVYHIQVKLWVNVYKAISFKLSEKKLRGIKMCYINTHLTVNRPTICSIHCTWLLNAIRIKRCTTSIIRYKFYGFCQRLVRIHTSSKVCLCLISSLVWYLAQCNLSYALYALNDHRSSERIYFRSPLSGRLKITSI